MNDVSADEPVHESAARASAADHGLGAEPPQGRPGPPDRRAEHASQAEPPWDSVVGQTEAVRRLKAAVSSPVHAYLLVGPAGVGKRRAALAFAGELLASASPQAAERHRRLARAEKHPDIYVLDPAGNTLRRAEEAEALIAEASRSPVEGARKVLVVDRFHTATPAAAAALLKTIEEPPATSIFVLLAEQVIAEHVTIASRCTQIDFAALSAETIAEALVNERLADAERAHAAALAAGGSIQRARLLADDEHLQARREAWRTVPDRLDGSGASVASLVAEVRALIDGVGSAMDSRHQADLDALGAQEEATGRLGSQRSDLEAHQRRQRRMLRTEELRFGLATLAARYRDAMAAGDQRQSVDEAIDRIRAAAEALARNPNEALLLQALFGKLPPI